MADCPPGSVQELVVEDRIVALYNVDGTLFALDGVCPHQGGPLGKGALEGCLVTCPWHGWQFDVTDGRHQPTGRHRAAAVRRANRWRLGADRSGLNRLMASECRSTIEYRAFRNADLAQLAEIWRSQPQQRGLMQPMSVAVLERFVFSKPMFDRRGLIVALDGDTLVGFAHAGFGPTSDRASLSTAAGATALVMLRAETETAVAGELLARAEDYLRAGGARRPSMAAAAFRWRRFISDCTAAASYRACLESDERLQSLFREAGYHPAIRSLVLQCELAGFRPPIDRQQLQIRRQTIVEMVVDPPTTSWWEACMFEPFDRTRCDARRPKFGACWP